ncbi:DUF4262 domain-containing protein [Mucilaginibacter sp. Mucisp86]|uniref:DUF4262 domain-containing protein n=1 Tax=Mucilaginibacter sp. Mucisp86 TaxID=3243060 RepID=UPI0039B665C9
MIRNIVVKGMMPPMMQRLRCGFSVSVKNNKRMIVPRSSEGMTNVKNSDISEYALTSVKFYQDRNYEYLQLIFPDLNGKFPNEVGYNYDQKVLGNLR